MIPLASAGHGGAGHRVGAGQGRRAASTLDCESGHLLDRGLATQCIVRRRAAAPQTFLPLILWYGEYAGRCARMLPKEDLFAAPHTPRPRYGNAAPRTSFRRVAAHRQRPNPMAGAGSQPDAARSSIGAKRAV